MVGINADHANEHGDAALAMASQDGHCDTVRALLAVDGINANHHDEDGNTALHLASSHGHAEVVRTLLATDGIDANHTNQQGSTALTQASCEGHTDVVRALLAVDGTDANRADDDGDTALILACRESHTNVDVVLALPAVEGLKVNHPNVDGHTALMFASNRGNTEVVHALLATAGIDANHTTVTAERTALMLAVWADRSLCARALVAAKGTLINFRCATSDGGTALHHACKALPGRKAVDMVRMLLLAGGCRFRLDGSSLTAEECAWQALCSQRGPRRRRRVQRARRNVGSVSRLVKRSAATTTSSRRHHPGRTKEQHAVLAVFASGIDHWHRLRHTGHSWAMRETVTTLLLLQQRWASGAADARVRVPPEI